MSVRLQVIMNEQELDEYRRRASREGLTLSEWVRSALREAAERLPAPDPAARLRALDAALRCDHPSGELDELLEQIERGRDLH